MRSALNFFTVNSFDLENNLFLKRLFKYFYQVRPLKPRYLTFWPVDKVLNTLRTWFPLEDLPFRELTLKTVALIALTSSDRGQTLHLAKLSDMVIEPNGIKFVIKDRIKTTRRVLKPTIIISGDHDRDHDDHDRDRDDQDDVNGPDDHDGRDDYDDRGG